LLIIRVGEFAPEMIPNGGCGDGPGMGPALAPIRVSNPGTGPESVPVAPPLAEKGDASSEVSVAGELTGLEE
jgi:hypothetical protein